VRRSQGGIHNTSERNRPDNKRGNASHFQEGKPPRVECHAGIFGASGATALIWIMLSELAGGVTSLAN
jgi:hypothetical protein